MVELADILERLAVLGGLSEAAKQHLMLHGAEGVNPGFKPHVYKVTAREEADDLLTITLTFSGNDMKNP